MSHICYNDYMIKFIRMAAYITPDTVQAVNGVDAGRIIKTPHVYPAGLVRS